MNEWKTTSTSMVLSTQRQRSLAQRWLSIHSAVWFAGSNRTWVIRKWLSAKTNSPRPLRRMRYQIASSVRSAVAGRGRPTRGERVAISTAPDGLEDVVGDGQADDHEDEPRGQPDLAVVPGHPRPEVHDDDPQAVQGVVEQGRPEEHLPHPPGGAGVDRQDVVV